MPFAVVGSDKSHTVDGKEVLGRKTNWGLIEGKFIIIECEVLPYKMCILLDSGNLAEPQYLNNQTSCI